MYSNGLTPSVKRQKLVIAAFAGLPAPHLYLDSWTLNDGAA